MNDEVTNNIINKYISDNLSPTEEQRNYITEKYEELHAFLSGNCFQTGSYARFTAGNPVHDLDTFHPVKDASIKDDPSIVLGALYGLLEKAYSESTITKIKGISIQTHSVTIEFADAPQGEFNIDIVPAIELDEKNEYGDPLYCVPEILLLNKHNRQRRYEAAENKSMSWIKSDPRGYIKAASDLNKKNSAFRHTSKWLKSWRHACKLIYGDDFHLKSFHLEQIIFNYFIEHPDTTTLEAAIGCMGSLPTFLDKPQFPDRADPEVFIDGYITGLSPADRRLILRLQAEAYDILRKIPGCMTEQEVISRIKEFLAVKKQSSPSSSTPPSRTIIPPPMWGN